MSEPRKRSTSRAVALPFLGAGIGAAAALAAAIVFDVADVLVEAAFRVRGLSWEMGLMVLPFAAAVGGLPAGLVGALIGRPGVGGASGALGLGVLAFLVLANGAGPMPTGTRVSCVAAGVLCGFAAGAAGGALTRSFERRQRGRIDSSG